MGAASGEPTSNAALNRGYQLGARLSIKMPKAIIAVNVPAIVVIPAMPAERRASGPALEAPLCRRVI